MGRAWVAVFVSLAVVAASGPASARSGASAEAGPGITVTFLPAPSPTVVGRPVFMPIRVVNTATGQTLAVTLTVQAPVWVRLAGPRCTARRGSLVCPIRDLAPRASVTVRVRVTSTRLGSFRIQAQAVARAAEPADTSGSSERTLAATTGFQGSVLRITPVLARRMTGVSWRPGCPVALENLRVLRLSYWDFTGRVRTGTLVVNRDAAAPLLRVFGRLYAARYPIRRMTPVDAATTTGRSRTTTRRPSTAVRRRGRRTGRSTPTAVRSTSTHSRTPTSAAAPRHMRRVAATWTGHAGCRG
jgi:hypothetical protein